MIRNLLRAVGLLVGIGVVISLFNHGHSDKTNAGSPAPAAAATITQSDPSMNYRTRRFIHAVDACARTFPQLAHALSLPGSVSVQELADVVTSEKRLCDTIADAVRGYDTDHFFDQAIDGQVALDDYRHVLKELQTFIDTGAPTIVSQARFDLQDANGEWATAKREINLRRRIYGLPPIS